MYKNIYLGLVFTQRISSVQRIIIFQPDNKFCVHRCQRYLYMVLQIYFVYVCVCVPCYHYCVLNGKERLLLFSSRIKQVLVVFSLSFRVCVCLCVPFYSLPFQLYFSSLQTTIHAKITSSEKTCNHQSMFGKEFTLVLVFIPSTFGNLIY